MAEKFTEEEEARMHEMLMKAITGKSFDDYAKEETTVNACHKFGEFKCEFHGSFPNGMIMYSKCVASLLAEVVDDETGVMRCMRNFTADVLEDYKEMKKAKKEGEKE